MNIEPIDTSTTAGKAEVMRLAAEGRGVAFRHRPWDEWKNPVGLSWDWSSYDYAIIRATPRRGECLNVNE